jgi:hypothetical protein
MCEFVINFVSWKMDGLWTLCSSHTHTLRNDTIDDTAGE